ncbi:hypothetical protein F370042G1_34130 [Escherichia coli]|nr:hypothetical protein ECZU21_41750 [Escherichia coli]GHL36130.1 hypothetical protein ECZU27_12960 [Escherichia coli]GHL69331.1 hypothetical protein ECZU33_18910 [Escherichia coli]
MAARTGLAGSVAVSAQAYGTGNTTGECDGKKPPGNGGSEQPPGLKWFTEFGHLNRGDMLTSEQHRCSNEKKKFQS